MRSRNATMELRAALSEEVRHAMAALGEATPRAVHRCRVRLKRARALAQIGAVAAPGLAEVFIDLARSVMDALAPSRDLAALADTARDLAASSKRKSAASLRRLAQSLDEARASLPSLDLSPAIAGVADLLAVAQVWPETNERQIRRGVRRVLARARRARRRAFASRDIETRHHWRRREKERLYVLTIFPEAWPEKRAKLRARSERLGDLLGRERDCRLLLERLESEVSDDNGKSRKRAARRLRKKIAKLSRRADILSAALRERGC